jgi:hypothetical protein
MNADWTERRIGYRTRHGLYMLRPMANDYAPVFMDIDLSTREANYRLVVDRFSGDTQDMNLLYVGDRLVRWLKDRNLPDVIKSKLAMVDAIDTEWESRARSRPVLQPYNCPHNKLLEVGWRVSKCMYTVIVPERIIVSLRGEPLSKEKQE